MRGLILGLAALLAAGVHADAIDDVIRANMAADTVPGVALAVVAPDGKADIRTYGIANVELGTPVTPETVFRWASLSKQFTSMSVHLLIRDNKISLDDSIRKYIPEAPEEWEDLKIIHLLTHTGGIPDPGPLFDPEKDYTLRQYLAMAASNPLKWNPGAQFEYSNPGYSLLGVVVSKASGVPFPEFVRKNVFTPAGMATARHYRSGDIVPNRAGGYRVVDGELRNDEEDRPEIYGGSGGVMGSIRDLVAWDAYLRKGGPGADIIDAMKTKATLASGAKSAYSRGWYVSDWNGHEVIRHGGDTWGFTANMIRDVTSGWTVLILRNSTEGEALPIARKVYDLVSGG